MGAASSKKRGGDDGESSSGENGHGITTHQRRGCLFRCLSSSICVRFDPDVDKNEALTFVAEAWAWVVLAIRPTVTLSHAFPPPLFIDFGCWTLSLARAHGCVVSSSKSFGLTFLGRECEAWRDPCTEALARLFPTKVGGGAAPAYNIYIL